MVLTDGRRNVRVIPHANAGKEWSMVDHLRGEKHTKGAVELPWNRVSPEIEATPLSQQRITPN